MTALFITILNMSITAGVVALFVILVRLPLKKAPKIYSYVLWSVVLFRLICPFSFDSGFSLMPTLANIVPQSIIFSQNPAIQSGVALIDNSVNTAIGNALPPVNPASSINPIQPALEIYGFIWLLGFSALLTYTSIGYIKLKRRVCFATLIRDNIYETDKIKSPFVFGFIRPKIYIPTSIDMAQYDFILKHEQIHIVRRDYLIKPFAFIVLALHWFNPLVWLSYFLMSKDMEMSCDEAVLRKADDDIRHKYSASLLRLSTKRADLINPLAFGESDVKSRIKNVLNYKKTSIWITVVSVLVVAVFLVGFIPNRTSPMISVQMPSYGWGAGLIATKTETNKTDEEIKNAMIKLAIKDAHNGIFGPDLDTTGTNTIRSQEYEALASEYVQSVSPDRRTIFPAAIAQLEKATKLDGTVTIIDDSLTQLLLDETVINLELPSVQYDANSKMMEVHHVMFTCGGENIGSYSITYGWGYQFTQEEQTRNIEIGSLYYDTWTAETKKIEMRN